jgi:hypothetical protein
VNRRSTEACAGVEEGLSNILVVWIGERLVVDRSGVVKGSVASECPIDELIDHHEVFDLEMWLERPDRARGHDGAHSESGERPDIGAERDPMSDELVGVAVAGEERHPTVSERADSYRPGRRSEGRADLDVGRVVEEVVEAGATEDPHLGTEVGGARIDGDEHLQSVDDVEAEEAGVELVLELELELVLESVVFELPESLESPVVELDESVEVGADEAVVVERLSVLKKPDPLKVTPTG